MPNNNNVLVNKLSSKFDELIENKDTKAALRVAASLASTLNNADTVVTEHEQEQVRSNGYRDYSCSRQ